MSHTVEEARGHSCPHLQQSCRADLCMMWRWKYDKISVFEMQHKEFAEKGFEVVSSGVASGVPTVAMIRNRQRGYCGLAGEPEV